MSSTSRLHARSGRRFALATLIAVLALLIAAAAGPTPHADANPPFVVHTTTGIVYNGPGTALDLYVPDLPGTAKLPLVIWTDGCAWLAPDCGRAGAARIADTFNPWGYAVAGVSVRSSFEVEFPGQLYDIRAAIRWLRSHAATLNVDPDRFAIMGFSSGGWTSVIAGTTSDEAHVSGESGTNGVSSAVQAVVAFSSPTDFLQMDQWHDDHPQVPDFIVHDAPLAPLAPPWLFPAASPESLLVGCTDSNGDLLGIQACPGETEAANPVTYVEGDEAPMLLLHGFMDPLVPHGQSELLYAALAGAGNEVTFISVDNAGHNPDGPPGFLGNPIIGAADFTVFHTNRGGQETIGHSPAPTWETIEHFIHVALSRARGG